MKSKKILFFGAGMFVKNYMLNFPNYQYIGCIDNDSNKIGTTINGLEILPIDEILILEYDKIVITSIHVQDITEQLLNLKIENKKILVPDKALLTSCYYPFNTKTNIIATIKKIEEIFYNIKLEKLPLMLDMGTLLGYKRNLSLIPWDTDVDLIIDDYYFNHAFNIISSVPNLFYTNGHWELTLKSKNSTIKVDIGLHKFEYNQTNIIHSFFGEKKHFPKDILTDHSEVKWQNGFINIPKNSETYLEQLYGENWLRPTRNFTFDDYNWGK